MEGFNPNGADAGRRIVADRQKTLERLVESFFALTFPGAGVARERICALSAKNGSQIELLIKLLHAVARRQILMDGEGVVDPC
ncbi:hypothetical protein D3C81_1603390 [compost metagenome]